MTTRIHPDPTKAHSHGAQSLYPDQFAELMTQVRVIARAIDRELVPTLAEATAG